MEIKIDSLHMYPLKSAKGISLESMTLLRTGPQWDREWMLIDQNNDFKPNTAFEMDIGFCEEL